MKDCVSFRVLYMCIDFTFSGDFKAVMGAITSLLGPLK